jgi:glycosyltransferase involved in cell wall biosynthesis
MIKVLRIFRKRNPAFFSIEKVFALIQPELESKVQLHTVTLPYYSRGIISIFRNLYFLSRRRSKSIYHVTGDVHYAVFVLPASKTLLTIHDCGFLSNNTGIKRKILKWLFLDMPVKRAALVNAISEFTRQEILRFTNCAADKVMVIPNPVNDGIRFEKKTFNAIKPIILFIGTTCNKNLERVIPALEDISCHLRILGRPTTGQDQLLFKYRLDFSFVSNISESELADQYVETDIVLFPSTFEGFGLPILEGQKAGRVVITSNIEPMKSVAGDGAFFIDPYDINEIRNAIKKIIEDAGLRANLIKKGFENIQHYNASAIADAYYRLYKKLEKNN